MDMQTFTHPLIPLNSIQLFIFINFKSKLLQQLRSFQADMLMRSFGYI